MRTEVDQPSKKEVTFQDSRGTRRDRNTMRTSSSDESDQEEANFVKQLTRGSRKQKGKLPLKHFNCGKVGCFPSKCPYIDTSKN